MPKPAWLWYGLETIGCKWLLLVVGCITSFLFVLVCFELLQILVQSRDLFSIPMKIHAVVLKIKKQNNFIFSSLII